MTVIGPMTALHCRRELTASRRQPGLERFEGPEAGCGESAACAFGSDPVLAIGEQPDAGARSPRRARVTAERDFI